MNGQPELAIQHFQIGMRLNPQDTLGFALGIRAGLRLAAGEAS